MKNNNAYINFVERTMDAGNLWCCFECVVASLDIITVTFDSEGCDESAMNALAGIGGRFITV